MGFQLQAWKTIGKVVFIMGDKSKPEKFRGFNVTRSYDYESKNTNETEEEWKERLSEEWDEIGQSDTVDYFVYIFHDRDVLESGQLKPLHAQGVIRFKNPRSVNGVMKYMGTSTEQNTEHTKSYVDSARYLLHVSEKALNARKFIYDISDAICHKCNIVDLMARDDDKKEKADFKKRTAELGKSIRTGELTKKDVEKIIVKEFDEEHWRRVRTSYEIDEQQYLKDAGEQAMIEGVKRTVVYASGAGGAGKSSTMRKLSTHFIDGRGLHKVSVGGRGLTFDFAGTYGGQKVTIANDMDSSYFHHKDFFGLFDPNDYNPVKSRNIDKHWLADHCYITNSKPINKWIFDLIYYSDRECQRPSKDRGIAVEAHDLVWQASRRFAYWLHFEDDRIIIKKPNKWARVKDGYGGTVSIYEEFAKGTMFMDSYAIGLYFEKYAEIKFTDFFKVQDEIAEKIAKLMQGETSINGVTFF